jgi:lipoate-protein ligase A
MDSESSLPARGLAWHVEYRRGTASDLHALDLPEGRSINVMVPTAPALVLGSTQSPTLVNTQTATAMGVDVCQRRTGGGVVFVHPQHSVWVDVVIPRDDPQWVDDVARSSMWLGGAFVEALTACAVTDASVYTGNMVRGEFGAAVCFASAAPGEVFLLASNAREKVVGVSQRRGRSGARFQCILYRKWTPQEWSGHLTDADLVAATNELAVRSVDVSAEDLVGRLHRALEAR